MQKNKVQLIGHLFDEPVFSKLETGRLKAVLKLTILTEINNGEEEKVTHTEVYTLICRGKFAEFVKTYMVAGIEMAVDMIRLQKHGRLHY